MEITIKDIKLNFVDEGQGNTVLLLHGWGSSIDIWSPFINALKSEIRFVALDFPGCGKSEEPKNPLTIEDYADIVEEFINRLDLKDFSMVGHSHGGRVIMKLAGEGRVAPKRIIFIDAAGVKPKKSFVKTAKVLTYKTARKALELPLIRNYTENTINKLRSHFGSSDYSSASDVMRKTLVNLVNSDMTPLLKNITCPTFLIWGDKDTATPLYMAETIQKYVKDTGICVYEGTDHFSFIRQIGRTTAIFKSFLGE